MAVDTILSIVSPLVELAIGSSKTHISNAFYCKSNLRHLKEEVDKLKNARERLQHLVDEDRRKGKVIQDDVAKWLLEVDGITEKVERELAQDEGGVKKKCFMGLCPNFKTRYQFGKIAEEKLATVKAKLEEQRSFGSISYHAAPSGVEVMSGKGYQAMQSRIPVFNEIMNALKAADVNIVGVYGMGGVGKTTLVKEVSKQAIEDKLFDKMVIASVTRNPDIMKIQGQIADQLGLTFNEESEWGRAGRLRERLKLEKKILVVLDDLWKRLDLEAIGISFKDEQNECKMLLTSREFDVLSSEMEVEKNFSISGLKEDEAWELFKKTAGGNVESPDVQSIALKIATKCAGLPLAIVTVAKALKDKRLSEWKDALRELKRPSPRNFTGVQAEVYSAIELSYKHLGSEELKAIFLLSSRMGYNASIQDLLKYSMGSGLFSDVATIEEVRDKVNSLLHKLKTSSLLLDGDTSTQFSIHDVVRDVAISIAFRDHNVFLRSDEVELKWQYKDSLESHAEIWLHGNSFGFPEDLQYPLLKVLNMNSEDSSLEVPENIFRGMQKLKVLGLTNLSFPAPHSSLHFLKNLRSLCLHQSSLGEIAIIGELKKLEILSFVKSNIKHLPKEIGQLTKLKLLDLSDCSELEVISPNVISNLSLLEELFVGNSFHHWDIKGHDNASLIELEHLSHLTNLDVHMLDSHVMSMDLFSRKLERFRIFIGDVWDWDGAYETLRTLKLKLNESTDHLKHGVLMLLKRTEDLYLLEMKGIKNVICELDSEGFPQLKYLHLHNSPDIQYIIDTMKGVPANILPFPMLESLFLYNLVSLEKIYHGTLKTPSFGKLQKLEVKHCNKLKNLFSFSIARGLLLLQSINITCCRNLEEIVVEESEEFDNKNEEINLMEFTQVRSLSLKYLPNLRNFCSKEKASSLYQTQSKSRTTGMDFGEIILEDEPHAPMQLFDEKFVFPNLEDLKLHSINIERLWHGQLPAITVSIQNLQRLVVKKCGSLKYIFSSSMVKSLVQLKHLAIHDCMSVEEIIVTEELDEEERTSKMVFLKLEHIELLSLPKLKHFCIGSHIECPLLKRLVIDWCHDFQTFVSEFSSTNLTTRNGTREANLEENLYNAMQPLFDEKVVFPCLAEIQISHIDKIWHNQLAAGSFCELRSMSISDCDKLVNIFPSILLTRFQRLEMLEISHCHSLETIFELQGLGGEEIQAFNVFQLQDLDLYNLPKLKHIWNKDPQGRLIFQNLHSVRVGKCSALKNLFPVSIARDLPQLEKLEIKECGVEEIVANAEGDETAPRFDFPHLTSLTLEKIPEFRNFYPGKHSWECPILKSLEVSGCGNVKLFGSESHTSQEIQRGSQQDQIQQPLFFVEKVISTLEELSLSGENPTTSIIWRCQLPEKYYSAVKLLRLHYFQEESDTIPFGFIQILCNLETLYVTRSSFKRLFSYEGLTDVNQRQRMLGRLRNFKIISSVGDMRHMWKDNDQLVQFLQNLGTLEVISCHSLVNLAPSSASFENLTILDVRCCFGLLNLITSSTAKSLVQLVKLTVRSCKKVMEIVAKERDETEDEIIFSKLEYLELVKLESLTSFCPGNHTFKFPSLKEIVVRQCPKMRIFSPRVVSTPKLQGVCFAKVPTLLNATLNAVESILGLVGLAPSKKRTVQILQDISGIVKPSRMALLLGPPSSGKTTMLMALAGKLHRELRSSGKITYCGHELKEFVPQRSCAYISQHDLHYGEMTVRETLDFSGRCLGVGTRYELLAELSRREKEAGIKPDPEIDAFMKATAMSGQEHSLVTDYTLKILGLDICADILVGNDMKRGISGGQKKRVTTGEMLVGPAKVLLMDEISTGLDSATTFQICKFMRQMVHTMDVTMIVSLLQPAPETFELFDDIILLSEGQVVYQGPREHVLEFFEHMGFRCPDRKGAADFLQEVTSKKDQEQYWFRKNIPYRFISVPEFVRGFNSFHVGQQLASDLRTPYDKSRAHPAALVTEKYGISNWELFRACFSREWLLMKRNSFLYIFKTTQITIMSIIAFTVFFRTEMKVGTVLGGQKYFGALFFSLVNVMFNGMAELSMTVFRLPVFYKQRDFLFFPAWAFGLPIWVLRIPLSLMESAIWIILTYYTIGFAPSASRFFRQFLAFFCIHQMALALFRFIAAVGRTQVVANTLGTFTLLLVFVLGGFIVAKDDIEPWMIWGYYSSPMMYGQNAIVMNEFLDERWSVNNTDSNFAGETVGKVLLKARGFFTDDYWFWICIGALFGFSLLFNVLFIGALTFLNPLGDSKAVVVDDDAKKNKKTSSGQQRAEGIPMATRNSSEIGGAVDNSTKRGMVLPFQPLSLAFNHVSYYVDMPDEMKSQGIDEERLQLLRDVSGAFRPGILTALVGVSGAGKTTLMDVLAGRKTGGYIEGSINISGYPKNQDTFARVSGYCEQNDIHSPRVTVYESLLYSAWLRLSKDIDTKTRKMFVEEVMELVELNPLRDALVGLPGLDGLSTEQRKRLTIAVELVANPSIIFMDEPTSGLDARAAAIVMRTVRNTVDTGRTVVCTIHQPSIDIFEAFDELLLMKRGGQVIYAGSLGHRSHKLIEYFEAVPGVPKIRDAYNPATWMLEISAPSMEAQLDVDFAEQYANSSLYQRNQEIIKELSTPAPGSKDLYFRTQYSQTFLTQCKACFWKQHWSYWRNPRYNAIRLFMTLAIGIIFGLIFWDKGQKTFSQQDLLNVFGAMYAAVLFLGATNAAGVQSIIAIERTVFYRERAAGMYSPLPYAFAQVAIEAIYVAVQTIVYSILLFSMMGFEWTAAKFLWFYYFIFMCFVYFTLFGMMVVALTPAPQIAAICMSFFTSFWNLFSGFLLPRPQIPIWWRWYYWCSPVAWTLYGLVTSQVGDKTNTISVPGETERVPIKEFLKGYLGFEYDFLPAVAAAHLGWVVLFFFLFSYGIKFLNFQKR